MAYTIENNYTGNGSTRLYSFTFPYLEDTDVKVSLNQVATTNFTLANATQIQFSADDSGETSTQAADGSPKSSVAVRVYRDTDISSLQSEFFSGSAVRAQDLNNDFNQTLYVSQETEKAVEGKWNDSTQTLDSTEAFVDSNDYIMTAAAIDDRIVADIAAHALTDGKIWAGNGSGVSAQVTPSGDVTMANTGAFTIASTSVETGMIANDAVTGAKIADDSVDSEHLVADSIDAEHYGPGTVDTTALGADAVTGAKIADDAINSEHYVDASIDAAHIASSAVTTAKINADAVTGAKIADDALDSEHYVDGSIDTAHLAADAITGAKIADDALDSEHYVDGSIDTAHLAADCVTGAKIADDALDSEHYTDGSIDADHIAANAVTFAKIGCEQTTISDTDTSIPTSGAVVDYVAAQLLPLGGFEAIATEDVFPASQPAAGVIVSIADATEIQVNNADPAVSTNCRTDGNGSDNVTITGFPDILKGGHGDNANPYVLPASSGLLVISTGSSHTYTYHRLIATTEDIKLLSDTVESFKARYRVASSAPGSDNTDGDIYYNTSNDTLYVYDGSQWEESVTTTPGDDTVTGAKIVDDAIDSEHYTDGSIDTAHYAASSVDATALASNAVTTAKINADAVTGAKIADDAIDSEHYVDGSIDTAHLADDQVTLAKMAGLARGKIIYGDSSGNPAALAIGTSGYSLVSDGTDISWGESAAGAAGGGSDKIFWENGQTVTTNYTITNNTNAGTFGPVTINSSVTVTIGSGEYWVII